MAFGNENNHGGNNGHNNNQTHEDERSIKIMWQDFPMSHLIKMSLVFQERPKAYKSPYFSFFTAWPKGGDSYIQDQQISFMLELPKLRTLGKALRLAANGCIPQPNAFVNWADSSKAAVQGEDTEARSSKKLVIYSIPGPTIGVSLTFERGKLSNQQAQDEKNYKSIPLKLTQAESLMLADYIDFLADEGRKLDFDFKSQAPMHVVRKKIAQIHEKRRAEKNSGQQGGSQQQNNYQGHAGQGQTTQGQYNTVRQQPQEKATDQTLIMQAFPFLPVLDGVFFSTFDDSNGKFLKAEGNVAPHIKDLVDVGFQFTDGVPFWWRSAAA